MIREIIALHVTDVLFPPGHLQEGEVGPVLAFAVVHEAGVLLFDTGVGSGEPEVDEWYRPVHRPLSEALSTHGLDIGGVTAVANSHLHFDHCGQNRLFADRPIYVQSTEYEAAHQPTTPWSSGSTSQEPGTSCWTATPNSCPGFA